MSSRSEKRPLMKGALVVTACFPVPAAIRTSLQECLTISQSRALYRRFLLDIMETTQDVEGMDFYLAYAPRGSRKSLESIVPPQFRLLCQEGDSRSGSLSGLFKRLSNAGYEKVLVLCTNHPDLPACMIHQAVETLENKKVDMVFGPNERGGFYLVGLKGHHPSLFSEIDWESPGLDRLVTRWAGGNRVRCHHLPSWYDIKTVEDLRRHLAYYTLRRDGSENSSSVQCETGRYLSQIKHRITPQICRNS